MPIKGLWLGMVAFAAGIIIWMASLPFDYIYAFQNGRSYPGPYYIVVFIPAAFLLLYDLFLAIKDRDRVGKRASFSFCLYVASFILASIPAYFYGTYILYITFALDAFIVYILSNIDKRDYLIQ